MSYDAWAASRDVMKSSKRIVAIAAILVGVPALLFCGFFGALAWDMSRVEGRAEICKALIPAIGSFKARAGRLPTRAEAGQMDPRLVAGCDYRISGDEFSMGLAGARWNMQVYNYSSQGNQWFWD